MNFIGVLQAYILEKYGQHTDEFPGGQRHAAEEGKGRGPLPEGVLGGRGVLWRDRGRR